MSAVLRADVRDSIGRYFHVPANWASAGIGDAMAFRIGNSELVHSPKILTPNTVVAYCNANARVIETDRPAATWADSLITCPTCLTRTRHGY